MEYGVRNIVDGSRFDKFFAKPKQEVINNGDNSTEKNVAKILPQIVAKYNWQTKKIANYLYDKDLRTFCENIWEFLFKHIQYRYDKAGVEEFRTPYRSWYERESGIDCDCFSIFVSCILTNKHIPHYFRITKYSGKNWQHIYVIVPKGNGITFNPDNSNTYWTIDCVIHQFNCEKEYTEQKLQAMNGLGIITQTLNGLGDTNNDAVQLQILTARNWALENPKLYESQNGQTAEAFAKMCDYALQYWNDPVNRDKAIAILQENEKAIQSRMNGLESPRLAVAKKVQKIAQMKPAMVCKAVELDFDEEIEGMGAAKKKTEKKQAKQEKKAAKKEAKQQKKEEKKAVKAEKKEIKQTAKQEAKQERKENKQERKEERQQAGTFFEKVGVALKQGAQVVAQQNPVTIATRGAFLFAVKMNLFSIAKKLHPAYCDDATAKKMGYTSKQIDVAKKSAEATEKVFVKNLGGTKAHLKEAVLIGYLKKAQGSLQGLAEICAEMQGINNLGVVTAAVTASSLIASVPVFVEVLKAILNVEKQNGVSGLGSMEDEIMRTDKLMRNITPNDIVAEMRGLGLAGEETAESASAIAKFIKMVLEKIKGAIQKVKDKKSSTVTTTTTTKSKSASSGTTAAKTNIGNKVKTVVDNLKEKVSGKKTPKEGEPGSATNPARAVAVGSKEWKELEASKKSAADASVETKYTSNYQSSNYQSSKTKNMESNKGLGTGAKIAIGVGVAAAIAGIGALVLHRKKKNSQPPLNGCGRKKKPTKTITI